jgi:cytochrome c oxidase assembly protein subunit 15
MLFSYTVLFTVIYVLYNTAKSFLAIKFDKSIFNLLVFVIILTSVQTVLGTQVTANVEELLKQNVGRSYLVENFNAWFYIHRSFSIVLLLSNAYLIYKVFKIESNGHVRVIALLCLLTVIAEALVGVTLNYLDYPRMAQPMHLLLGTVIAGGQLYLYIIYQKQKRVSV